MSINVRMMPELLLVKPEEKRSPSSLLIIPESAKENINAGMVVEVGPEVYDIHPDDVIMYKPFPGPVVKIDDVEYIVMNIDRVLLVDES